MRAGLLARPRGEGLADAYAAAGRLPRAEGPCRSCLGVRVRRVARKVLLPLPA